MVQKKSIGIIIGDISKSAGTERAVTNLSNILQESGEYQVIIISQYTKIGASCYYPMNSNIIIENLGMQKNGIIKRIQESKILLSKISEICKYHKIDVIVGTTHGYNIQLTKLKSNIMKIGCEHLNYNAAPFYSRFVRRFTYPKLDAIVCLTMKDAANYKFCKKSKVFVIPNSLSFSVENPAKLENKKIIAVGRLTKQKGWDYLIEAAPRIKEYLPEWHIDIFGTGEDKESLIKQMHNNHTEDYISIKEPTPNIKNEMLNSSIMIETSRWEGFPMVLVEAQACGLPLVGFDCKEGPSEIIKSDKCGYLMSVGDTETLADCIIKLAKDYELRKKMGMRSFELAKRFTPENIGKMWFTLFDKLLKTNSF